MAPLLASLLLLAQQGPAPLARSVRDLPELGVVVRDERWLDRAGLRIERRTSDERGRPVDLDALLAAEVARRDRRAGKLHPTLVGKFAAHGGAQDVAFWLVQSASRSDLRARIDRELLAGATPEVARRAALALAAAEVQPGNEAFAAAARAAGAQVLHVDTLTPVVFVRGEVGQVRRLAARADVDRVYWAAPRWFDEGGALGAPANEWASKTARTDVVHRRGITGQGVRVLVNDTEEVAGNNPFLPAVVRGTNGVVGAHATAVAGVLASGHVPQTGAAPGLQQLYSYGGWGDVVAPQAWAWGMAQGISFGNCSWWNGLKGQIEFLDRYFDYVIRHFAVMLFKSAGNQGGGDGKITTPGCGYNMFAVGNADDRASHDWDDDVMSPSSSWVDPIEGHTKPEVVSCGTTITTTTAAAPWIGAQGSGTSYAGPVACGSAALLAQTVPALQVQPEAVRALLMAGAFHNIEGACARSDRDGVGHIDAAASQSAAARGQYHVASLTPASFTNGAYDVAVPLVAGDETRLCAVWFSLADSSYTTDVLSMDLDLLVLWGNTVVAAAAAPQDPFEIVQFVPPFTGTYTVRLQQQRFTGTSEPFALAWVGRRNAATDEVIVGGRPAPGGTVTFDFVDTYHPGALYLAVLSLTGAPATMPVGPLKVLELGHDPLVQASVVVPGFYGMLDNVGRANASLQLPNIAWLTGLSMHTAMVTIDLGLPEIVEETSPVTTFAVR